MISAWFRIVPSTGEVLPGVPWGILRGGDLDGTTVITKSGAVGTDYTLVRIARECRRKSESSAMG